MYRVNGFGKTLFLTGVLLLLKATGLSAQVVSIVDEVPKPFQAGESAHSGFVAFDVPVAFEAGVPLPVTDEALYHPSLVRMGAYAVEIASFRVALDYDLLRHAYREELIRRGWVLTFLPWQEEQVKAIQNLEAQLEVSPQHAEAVSVREYVSELSAALKVMLDRHIFVRRGDDRAIVQLADLGEQGSEVVLMQWRHGYAHPLAEGSEMSDLWLQRNQFCDLDASMVSDAEIEQRYALAEGAEILAVSTAMDGSAETVFLREVAADLETIRLRTVRRMQAKGWQLAGAGLEPAGEASSANSARLSFRLGKRESDFFLMRRAGEPFVQTVIIADLERP